MINSITGILTHKGNKNIYVDCNGIEFELATPQTNIELLGTEGSTCRVYTYLQHTDTVMALYGFFSSSERDVFLQLLKVSGLGPKTAIKIMSNIPSQKLLSLIDSEDVAALERVSGIGKTCARKMVLALKGHLVAKGDSTAPAGEFSAVLESIISMGYDRALASQRLASALEELRSTDSFNSLSNNEKEDALFRKVLTTLAGGA